jgi:hypothetical protein
MKAHRKDCAKCAGVEGLAVDGEWAVRISHDCKCRFPSDESDISLITREGYIDRRIGIQLDRTSILQPHQALLAYAGVIIGRRRSDPIPQRVHEEQAGE